MRFLDMQDGAGNVTQIPILTETDRLQFNGGFMLGLLWGGLKAYEELHIPSAIFAVVPALEEQALLILNRCGWSIVKMYAEKGLIRIEADKDYDYGMQL
jgi:hypothetical protein